MAPPWSGQQKRRGVPASKSKSKRPASGRGRDRFTTGRLHEPEASSPDAGFKERDEPISSDASSDDDEDISAPPTIAYSTLLQSFQQSAPRTQPERKRKKLRHEKASKNGQTATAEDAEESSHDVLAEDGPDDAVEADEAAVPAEEIDEDEDLSDPFERHFASPDPGVIALGKAAVKGNTWTTEKFQFGALGKAVFSIPTHDTDASKPKRSIQSTKQLKLKRRLTAPAKAVMAELDQLQQAMAPVIFDYQDLLFGARTPQNATSLRQLVALHALNHIFKTRDRVIKNNARLAKDEDLELRDQGFTRPKVLVLLETRQACAKMVDAMMKFCEPEQQENKKRFQDAFAAPEDRFSDDKPADFRELFEGNDDNEFRIGIKFTRKTVKYFTQFYSSDIIFASPLGLRRVIESSGPKKQDSDFLTSIEVLLIDQVDAMLMQNWEHVTYVLSHMNQQPKEAHGCDFGRVRNWYLDGNASYLRQTIVFSVYLTPELNNLYNTMRNVTGKIKYQPSYDGAIQELGLPVKQTFSRLDSLPSTDRDARFKYFTSAIVPSLLRLPKPSDDATGILIFIPSYHDFTSVRNLFAMSTATQNVSFGAISEFTEMADVRRARAHFLSGRHSVLLYTGRAHHFRRHHIKGVKRLVMYGLPGNPIFYKEMVADFVGGSIAEGRVSPEEVSIRVMFSKCDGLALERIVGTKRVASMLREKGGDTFDFV